jgi:2-dehydropantoate 2-reductase
MTERYCVAGVGAIGGTVAAYLAGAGHDVSLIARGRRLHDLQHHGLAFAQDDGMPVRHYLPVSDRPEFGVQDVLFVAAKAHQLPTMLPGLKPMIGLYTAVVPLLNGVPWWYFQGGQMDFAGDPVEAVDPDGQLKDGFAAEQIIGCVVYMKAHITQAGTVSAMGEQRLWIGEVAGEPRARTHALAATLSAAGIDTGVRPQIRDEVWTKLALNLATNPLSVITGATLIEQFTDPKLLALVSTVIEEVRRVAAGFGITMTMTLDEMIETGRKAGAFHTSMLQDHRAGRPLELDAIGVAVLELAAKIGLHMPETRRMIDSGLEHAQRGVRLVNSEVS